MVLFDEKFIRTNCIVDKDDNVYHNCIKQSDGLFKIKNLLNPKYGHWELVTRLIKLYLQNYSSSAIASQHAPSYDNLLLLKAIITDKVDILDLEVWE